MHPRIEEVIGYVDSTRNDLADAIEAVPAARRDERPAPDRWSVAEILDHLNRVENRISQAAASWLVDARAAGLGPETDSSPVIDSINRSRIIDRTERVNAPDSILPQPSVNAEAAWKTLQASRDQLRATFETGDGLALAEIVRPHPVLGPSNLYQWILFVGAHEARHTGQIREIAAEFSAEAGASNS